MLVKIIKLENELKLPIERNLLGKIVCVEYFRNTNFYWCDGYEIFIPKECCVVMKYENNKLCVM